MQHYLTYKDETSDKFWNIEVNGDLFTVTYGKTGTPGQTQTKEFKDEATCLKEAKKLLNEKLKKGYVEKQGVKTDQDKSSQKSEAEESYLLEWNKLVNENGSDRLPSVLAEHFSCLADMPGFDLVLQSLMQHAEQVEIQDADETKKSLVVRFRKDDDELIASPPFLGSQYKTYPRSFQNIMKKHSNLYLNKAWLFLGNDGGFEAEQLEYVDSEWLNLVKKPSQIQVALTDYSNWWLYHPENKNGFGEPTIHFCSHEDMEIEEEGVPYNVGAFFLKNLVERLELDIPIPIVETPLIEQEKKEWWKYLTWIENGKHSSTQPRNLYYLPNDGILSTPPSDETWSQATQVRFTGLTSLIEVPLDKMSSLDNLKLFPGEEKKAPKLSSLDGIERAPGLVLLHVASQGVSNLDPLSKLPNLKVLFGSNNSIQDLSPLSQCRNLETLYLNANKISDISPLALLLEIETLWIDQNPIKDILPLTGLKKLKELQIPGKLPKENLEQFKKLRPDVKVSF
ncbi:WGR domain-containing protein [Leptospira weilii]|uniref:WGR domain-containing protein n=1 Tax=Leptospira weilii TaxID=28184 RepID=UPI0009C06645|nr:WGR domain-containing protein [Leptospira weilii]QDK22055.1 WGR domain-containing protein [Leptospira weilii]QDK25993.1 WGR domain-containing protein [Leptospira weilii]